MGVEPQRGLTGDALFAQVKELAQRWVMESAKFNKGIFLEVLKDYDPSKDGFFTEAVLEAMRDLSERPTPAKKRPADRVAAVLAEINACPDREDRDLPGSLF